MLSSQTRAARWAITGGLAAFLAIAAAGFPTQAHAFVCNGQFDLLQKGYCSSTTTQGCGTSFDAACPAGETCKTFNFVDPGDPEKDGADQLRTSLAVGTSTITGPTGAPNNLTMHKVRFDLDCVQNSGGNGTNSLCADQGDVVEYMGDATITTDCPGVTWTSSQPLGGVGANEVVFTPSAAIVIPQSCAPSQQSPPPACGGCKLEFGLRVVHQEPAGSDGTPQLIEQAAGYIQGQGDAVCNEGLTGSLQSGSTQTANIPICPSCTIDQCNLGCDEQTTGECTPQTASTPCADTDGNTCTTAGCELSEIPGVTPSQASIGVCVQTHLFAENSTPCADTDGNACTTAGCNGQGVCDQNHSTKVCPGVDECNKGCDTTSGQCTPQTSTPCTDSDGNTCTTAGCEVSGTNPELGVCVQTHLFASNSTPCADSDGNACTTAGCNGQGVCDQNHSTKVCPGVDECNKGCDTTSGKCTPQTSTPCTDSDGNTCTTAGCEVSGTNPELGVCVQTHLFAENSVPCADTDNNACTTAGCNGSGVCDQNHASKTCPPADECNKGCDSTSGQCTPQTSTPCTDTDGNACTTAGCEVDGTNPELGVCVQSHLFASNSTPCADTDGSSCTTAGCDGQGTCDQNHVVKCCSLSVEKTACVAPAPPPAAGCTGGAIALTLQYTGSTISGPTTVVVTGSSGASVTYDLPSLTNGDVLTTASENGFTIDATAHGQSKLGSKTTVTINGVAEVLHTSCSCKATPDTNLALCDPMCLDSSSPDNTTGFKGAPSPLWTLVGLKDPTLGTETCGGGGTTGECQTALPAGGADVEFTYKITNTGTTTVSDLAVEDDKLGIIDASQIVPLDPGQSGTLTTKQFVASTTRNTVTVTGNDGACMATAKAAVVAPCVLGYPFTSQNPRTSVAFNESEVLRAFRPATVQPGERLMVFYNDEHALTLGVRKVLVKSQTGTTMMTFPFTLLMHNPDGVESPQVGTTDLNGDNAGTDTATCTGFPDLCDRPLFPALFITDITMDPDSRAGDWQFGVIDPDTGDSKPENTPIPPNAVFGTWKGAVRTVDKTKSVPAVTVTPDTDPAKNHYNLDGGDTAPSGLTDQGYGAEVAWNVDDLLAAGVIERGHVYRVQFMVHDGDQNKVGGDTGEGCATVFVGEE